MPFPLLPPVGGQTLSVTITDDVGITENLFDSTVLVLTDAVGITESLSDSIVLVLTDAVGITDVAAKTATVALSDSVGITDSGVIAAKTAIGIDSVGISDTLSLKFSEVQSDSVGITDSLAFNFSDVQTDSVGITDALARSVVTVFTDSIGITDMVTPNLIAGGTTLTVTVTDSVGITDGSVVKTKTALGIDTVGITDTIDIFRDVALTDIIITDNVNIFDPADQLWIVDIPFVGITIQQTIFDSVGITDTDLNELVSFADTVTFSGSGTLTLTGKPGLYRPISLSNWSAKWDAIPITGPGTGTGGWLGGDGCWSINHPSNTGAIFTFGDTPVSTIFPIVNVGTSATSQGTATDRLIVTDAQAVSFSVGGKVQVYLTGGSTYRYGSTVVHKIASMNSGFGFTNLNLTTALPSAPAVGDVIKGVTGGTDNYFPNSSCVLWTTNNDLQLVSGTTNWIPNDGDGTWYWAGPMVVDSDGKLYVFPSKQQHDASPAGYGVIARGLFQFTWTDSYTVPSSATKITDMTGAINWGAAATNDATYNYIFGVHKPNSGDFSFNLYVARVARGSLSGDPATTWEFWTTTGWQTSSTYFTDPTNLVKLISNGGDSFQGVENTISAQNLNGSFKLTSKRGGVFGSDVTVWESTSITGTYTSRIVGSAPYSTPTSNDQTYLSNGHFELPSILDGNYLISVSRNRAGLTSSDYYAGSPYYRPMWFETAAANSAIGACALTGVGILATSGKPVLSGTISLSGDGTLTLAGKPAVIGTCALSGSGTLSGNGTGVIGASCAFLGNGLLAGTGTPALIGSTVLSGSGTLALAGTPKVISSGVLSGSGTLSTVGSVVGIVALSGDGSLIAQAPGAGTFAGSGTGSLTTSATLATSGSTALSGAGTLTGAGVPFASGTTALSGSGTLVAVGKVNVVGTVALSGAGTLSGTQIGQTASGTTTLVGAGTLAVTAGANFPGSATTSGSGTLTIVGIFSLVSVVTTTGDGSLGLSGAKAAITSAVAAFAGTGSLAPGSAKPVLTGATTSLFGDGSLALQGIPGYKSSLSLSGLGTLNLLSNTARTGYAMTGIVTSATATQGIPKNTVTATNGY